VSSSSVVRTLLDERSRYCHSSASTPLCRFTVGPDEMTRHAQSATQKPEGESQQEHCYLSACRRINAQANLQASSVRARRSRSLRGLNVREAPGQRSLSAVNPRAAARGR
jgi:hypothetical protein